MPPLLDTRSYLSLGPSFFRLNLQDLKTADVILRYFQAIPRESELSESVFSRSCSILLTADKSPAPFLNDNTAKKCGFTRPAPVSAIDFTPYQASRGGCCPLYI